jgi:hypothetical protein
MREVPCVTMTIQTKIGIAMSMPEGKLPGFYAQIVKALANRAKLFDRDKELLVVSAADERDAVLDVMRQYKIDTEELELVLLPAEAAATPLFEDYGFATRSDNRYLYRDRAALFALRADAPDAEPAQALQQIEEYLIASIPSGAAAGTVYAVDRQHGELMQRIAKAYRCSVELL